MKNNVITRKRQRLELTLAQAKRGIEILEAQISVLAEVENASDESPSIETNGHFKLRDAAFKGMESIGQFSKRDLIRWVNENYPTEKFNPKSLDRSVTEAID